MPIKVKATGDTKPYQKYVGYYNYVRRKPGDVFELKRRECPNGCTTACKKRDDCKHPEFSRKWMEHVAPSVETTPAPGEPTAEEIAAETAQGKGRKGRGSGDAEVI